MYPLLKQSIHEDIQPREVEFTAVLVQSQLILKKSLWLSVQRKQERKI
jgi:hypothetical protein